MLLRYFTSLNSVALPVSLDATNNNDDDDRSSGSGSIEREWPFILIIWESHMHVCFGSIRALLMKCKQLLCHGQQTFSMSEWDSTNNHEKNKEAKNCFMFCIHNSHFCHWIVQCKHLNLIVKHRSLASYYKRWWWLTFLVPDLFFFVYRSDTSGICSWFHCFCFPFYFFNSCISGSRAHNPKLFAP